MQKRSPIDHLQRILWFFARKILVVVIITACGPQSGETPTANTPAPTRILPTVVASSTPAASPSPAAERSIHFDSLHALSETTAWGMATIINRTDEQASNVLVRTTDGGVNWINASPWGDAAQAEDIHALFYWGTQHAWVATANNSAEIGFEFFTTVWHTGDGGLTWIKGNPTSHSLPTNWEMSFVDDQHGWLMVAGDIAAGSQAVTVFRTMNGGADWEEISSTSIDDWPPSPGQISGACYKSHLWFLDASTGWVMGGCLAAGFFLQLTQDGGLVWDYQETPPPAEEPSLLDGSQCAPYPPVFSTSQIGILLAVCMLDTLLIFPTEDGGQTWGEPRYRRERQISTIDFVDAENGWLLYFDEQGGKHLAVTRDGGRTWSDPISNLDYSNLSQLDFVDKKVGWALLDDESVGQSTLCKTLDGGINWNCVMPRVQPFGSAQ